MSGKRNGHALRGESAPIRLRMQVPRTSVACPDCEAPVGAPCLSAAGNVIGGGHRSRTRIATRAYLAAAPKPLPSSLARKVLTLYTAGPRRHVVIDGAAACGTSINYTLAVRRDRLTSGIPADVRCPDCTAALSKETR